MAENTLAISHFPDSEWLLDSTVWNLLESLQTYEATKATNNVCSPDVRTFDDATSSAHDNLRPILTKWPTASSPSICEDSLQLCQQILSLVERPTVENRVLLLQKQIELADVPKTDLDRICKSLSNQEKSVLANARRKGQNQRSQFRHRERARRKMVAAGSPPDTTNQHLSRSLGSGLEQSCSPPSIKITAAGSYCEN